MCSPYRPVVKPVERFAPRRHVAESADPHELVGPIEIAERREDGYPHGFLRLDELLFEQVDQDVALSLVEGVLAKLHDRREINHHGRDHAPCQFSHGNAATVSLTRRSTATW